MSSRLFIIDQSLTATGGHHFEYTRLLARSAQSAGLRPIIATHQAIDRQCMTQLEKLGEVKAVYRRSVYTSCSYLAGLAELKCRQTIPPLPGGEVAGWRKWLDRRRQSRFQKQRSRHVRSFLEDCWRLFSEVQFDESDQVFFTTMSELDLLALAGFLSCEPQTLLPTWHVQFHFSIFSGRPSEFDRQAEREAITHQCFQAALARIPYHNIRFYTTSRELLEQYRRFPMTEFSELPYPVEPRLFENQAAKPPRDRPLRLTIAGGVRREKAQKHYLGKLVGELWQSHLESGAVEIHVQTADPSAFGRRTVFGKSLRAGQGPQTDEQYRRHVHIHPHPLPEREYIQLLGDSDLGLLCYDSRRYYSRRAGILSEFLASGKPVIVPAGCWLARQISEPVFQHAEHLSRQAKQIDSMTLVDMTWDSRNAPLSGGVVCFDQLQNPWRCATRPGSGDAVHGVALSFRWQWPRGRDEFVHIGLKCHDDRGVLLTESRQIVGTRENDRQPCVYFRCADGTRRCEFSFRSAFSDSSISLSGLKWDFLTFDNAASMPLSRVGIIVADPDELPAAVAEIVNHYPHYLQSAVTFGEDWSTVHDPDFTLNALLDRQCRFYRAA